MTAKAKTKSKAAKKKAAKKKVPAKMPAKKAAKPKGSTVTETFQLNAPDAESVLLAGSFTDWENSAKKMRKFKGGAWKASVSFAEKEVVQYRFLVDGQWVDDPECQDRVPNGFGGENCLRQVGG